MKTVVSVTPIAVQRDSRTFKIAASMARMGHRSIVVEGEPSLALTGPLPFELITVGGRPADNGADAQATRAEALSPESALTPEAEAVLHDPQAPAERPGLVGTLDAFAAASPSWFRAVAGPPWRLMLRAHRVLRRMLFGPRTGPIGRLVAQPISLALYVRHYISTCRAVAAVLPPADLYYLHSQLQFPAVWWHCRRRGSRYVYDAHDLYWTLRQDGRSLTPADRGIWLVFDAVERASAANAAACVTVGPGVARRAELRFSRPFSVVRNAHDVRLDAGRVPDLRQRIGLTEHHLLLAVSGNHKRGMAVEAMLRAMTSLPESVHLAFLGAGYDDPIATARELDLLGRVHFLAPVPPTEIVPVIAGADLAPVLYYPGTVNLRHALPNGFFHAVAGGVPVLYPEKLVDLREICAEMDLGWEIDPESDASIVTAVRRLLDAPDELSRMREHVAEAQDRLSWEQEERGLALLVTAALDGRS